MKRSLPLPIRHAKHITAAMSSLAAVILIMRLWSLQKMKRLLFIFCSLDLLRKDFRSEIWKLQPKNLYAVGLLVIIMPITAFAANSKIKTILTNIQDTLGIVIKIFITLALVIFIWGVVRFILAAGNPQARNQAKGIMLYGIIAIAILAMMTGIVAFLQTYFGITPGQPIKIPQF